MTIKIPPREYWPKGFTTDFVTGFPDAPFLWAGVWYKPCTWFDWKQVDLSAAAWWHDLRYFLGWTVPLYYNPIALRQETPWPNERRSDMQRAVIDERLKIDFIRSEMHPKIARIACDLIVEWAGRSHYYWATPEELGRRGLD
jgi:hypothetical protein